LGRKKAEGPEILNEEYCMKKVEVNTIKDNWKRGEVRLEFRKPFADPRLPVHDFTPCVAGFLEGTVTFETGWAVVVTPTFR
jgi:hypothetical protein